MEVSSKLVKSREHSHKSIPKNSTGNFKYEAFHIVLGKPEIEEPDDLSKKFGFFLIVGRLLGVLPISGIFRRSYSLLEFNSTSCASITSITIIATLTVNLLLGLWDTSQQPKTNAYEIAMCVHSSLQFVWGWLIYLYFLVKAKEFLALFHSWAQTNVFYGMEDCHLKREANLMTLLIMISGIMENAVLHLEYVPDLEITTGGISPNQTKTNSFLQTTYKRLHSHWDEVLGYHWLVAVIAMIQHKCMLYTLNYLDIMIAVFCRALYYKFKVLYKLSYEHLAKPVRKGILSKSSKTINRYGWTQVVHDHKKLCDLFQEFEKFFSPLIFGSYAVNIYYICIQLLDGITTNTSSISLVHSIYAPWSFLHLILRIYLVSICGARVNSYAHRIRTVLQECPVEFYNAEISRTDKKVTTGPDIGFTGFGCFVVTKPFILKIVGVIFTFEIVLLQGKPSPTPTC